MGQSCIFRVIGLIVGLGFSFSLGTYPALALDAGFGIVPANPDPARPETQNKFVYELDPGEVKEDALWVRNKSDSAAIFILQPLDGLTTVDGAFTVTDSPAQNEDVGTWLELEETKVTVPGRGQKKINFRLTVPADTWVGDHLGGFAVFREKAEAVGEVALPGGTSAKVTVRVALPIYLTVRGEKVWNVKLIRKSAASSRRQLYLTLGFRNRGNVRSSLDGEATLYGVFGYYDQQQFGIGQVMPKKEFVKTVTWPGERAPLFGPYLLLGKINDTVHPDIAKPIGLFVFMFFLPLLPTFIFLLILFLLWLLYQALLWWRAWRLARTPVVTYSVKRGDTLMRVAAEYGLPWKLVAKINNLNAPFELSPAQPLYLPDIRGERREIKVPNYFAQLARPFANFGAWALGRVFRIDRFKRTTPSSRHPAPLTRHPEPLTRHPELVSGSRTEKGKDYLTAIVEPGDTLRSIAKHFQIDSKELIALNHLKFPFKLTEGQELKVPIKKSKASPERSRRIKRQG